MGPGPGCLAERLFIMFAGVSALGDPPDRGGAESFGDVQAVRLADLRVPGITSQGK